MALPSFLSSPLARLALVLAVVGAVVGGLSYRSWAGEWNRSKPKFNRCFADSTIKLRKPESMSGTEPHDTPDGRTVYLTPNASYAVGCLSVQLGAAQGKQLAEAMGEFEPDARAAKLVAMIEAVPRDDSGDLPALGMGYMVTSALKALPPSEAIEAAQKRVSEHVDCRFAGKPCAIRPPIPVLTWVGAGVGGLGLLLFGFDMARTAKARRAARPAKAKEKHQQTEKVEEEAAEPTLPTAQGTESKDAEEEKPA